MKQWFRLLTKGDKILIFSLLFLSIFSFFIIKRLQAEGRYVVIKSSGIEVQRFPISEQKDITLHGPVGETVVKVSDNKVHVLHSDCKAKICERSGRIHRAGEMIVCVPNKIVIRVTGKNVHSIDVITE